MSQILEHDATPQLGAPEQPAPAATVSCGLEPEPQVRQAVTG